MSRAGYHDDLGDEWALIRWRGAVASAIRGRRGQALLREMLSALDALPAPRLISDELEQDGEVCALGAVGRARSVDMRYIDAHDYGKIAKTLGVAEALVREVEFVNDDWYWGYGDETPEQRFSRVRKWVAEQIRFPDPAP